MPLYYINFETIIANHMIRHDGLFVGLNALAVKIKSFQFYYFPLGNLILLTAVLNLKKILQRETIVAFINIYIFFLLAETVLLLFHLTLQYNPILAELLFYLKFIFIWFMLMRIARPVQNYVLKVIVVISALLTAGILINLIVLLLLDTEYILLLIQLVLSGKVSLVATAKLIYTTKLTIPIYLQHILPLFLLAVNFGITFIFIQQDRSLFQPYSRLINRLNSKYPV